MESTILELQFRAVMASLELGAWEWLDCVCRDRMERGNKRVRVREEVVREEDGWREGDRERQTERERERERERVSVSVCTDLSHNYTRE